MGEMGNDAFTVTFWGVRGSIPAPGPETSRYGGNTSCIEVRCGDELFVIDGGSGLRELGRKIMGEERPSVDVLFTHTHWDHVCGVPFFMPAYSPKAKVAFWAGHLSPERELQQVLCEQMMVPFFPVPIDIFANCHYHDYAVGTTVPVGKRARVTTCPLNHPNRACGYRIDFDGRSVCVITDTEHKMGEPDQTILRFVEGADVMIYDAMFTDEIFPKFIGWGHSTWQEALRIATMANVGQAVLFHHDPNHNDGVLDDIGAQAEEVRSGSIVAREGMVLTL